MTFNPLASDVSRCLDRVAAAAWSGDSSLRHGANLELDALTPSLTETELSYAQHIRKVLNQNV